MKEVISFEVPDVSNMQEYEVVNYVSSLIYDSVARRYECAMSLRSDSKVVINMSSKAEMDKRLYNPINKALVVSGLCRNCKYTLQEKYCDTLYNGEYAYVQVLTEEGKKTK